MKNEISIGNGFYRFSVILWDYLIGNALFLLCNIMIPIFFIVFKIYNAALLVVSIYILALNIFPSFVALLYMYKSEDPNLTLFKKYIKGYKESFKSAFIMGSIMNFLIIIFYIDYLYFIKINQILGFIFIFSCLVSVVLGFSFSNLISSFDFSLKQMVQLSLLFFAKLNLPTLKSLGFLFAFGFMYLSGANPIIWFMFAGSAKILINSSKETLKEIYYFHTVEGLNEKNPFLNRHE